MRAAKMKERPTFQLMCQTDVQSIYHMQMPRWLFSDPRYCEMSLEAKVTYTFLLNRFQLSRRNGWVNERGEVFVIFPRKALAKELRICEQRVTAAFKRLVELKLVWEKRCGRGDANQIYLARVTPIEDPDYSCAPFITEDESEVRGSRTSDLEGLADGEPSAACQEPQNLLSKNREDRASRTAKSAFPEPQKLPPSKKEKRKIDQSHMEVRQSVRAPAQDGRTDGDAEEELLDILDSCELECFAPETALVFENAIERLFYADSFRIGNATLPQSRVRAKLRRLDGMILREAESKLRANQERNVKNSTAYTMAVLFNCIAESESDLTVEKRAEEAELHEETSEFLEAAEDLHSNLPASAPHGSEADGADWGFEEPVTEEAAAEPAEDEYLAADNAETLDASDEKSERTLFYELDFNELDRGLSEEERKEWNSIYASFRGRSAITGTIIGVDLYARYLPRSEARMLENKRELCAVVVPYRIPILIRESEMWELGEERPDFVLRNMVGASIDVIVTKVERTANRAQASRRQASRSQRRFFAAREDLHAVGSRITCRMLAVGPRRCLVDCYGYDLDMTQREIRYAAIPDLRTEFHPGSEIDCIVKEYHPRTGELIVSAKETEVNPFFGAEERHPVGSRRFAMISGKYGGGVFCNLPDGVTCMCNYSYQHEDADFMVGEHVMLMVQRYDQEKLQMYGKIMSKW